MTHSWSVRPVRPGDEEQVTRLFHQCFSRPQTVAHYRWKLLNVPWGRGLANAWVADAGQRIVGQYAGTPMPFKLGDNFVTILHACDVMTAPDYRRQGVLSEVGSAATAAWTEAGIAFAIGLHYGGWGSPRRRLGWEPMFKLIWLWRPLRPARLLARHYRLPGPLLRPVVAAGNLWNRWWDGRLAKAAAGVITEAVARPGPAFDALWESLADAYEALVVRNREWITYRYAEAPAFNYRIVLARRNDQPVGYLVYRVTADAVRKTGWIVDLFAHPQDQPVQAALLRAALHGMERAGADTARMMMGEGSALVGALRRAGFLPARGAYDASVVPLAEEMPHPALRDARRWLTLAGDYDAI